METKAGLTHTNCSWGWKMAKCWALAVMFPASFSSSQNAVVSRIVPFDVIGGISKQ